jgi:inhibitor of cysteine peptidase
VKLLVLLIAVLVAAFANRGIAAPPKTVTEADTNHTVALHVGQELILKLESNRSTGYSWSRADNKDPILTSLGEPTYKMGRAVPGAGGIETWTFRATKVGTEALKLEYRRPWEKKVPPAKTVLFYITVH